VCACADSHIVSMGQDATCALAFAFLIRESVVLPGDIELHRLVLSVISQ
jgi:hypothetical protein